MMVLAHRTWDPVDQARDKILCCKGPASTNLLSARIVGFDPPVFRSPSKFHPCPPAVLHQSVLAEQADSQLARHRQSFNANQQPVSLVRADPILPRSAYKNGV